MEDSLTVKDIFAMRREGRVEEAYEAIRRRYAVHHGHYTTLCMFWCAADMMMLRLDAVNGSDEASCAALHEAEKIGAALERLYPSLRDDDGGMRRKLDSLHAVASACRARAVGR